MDWENKGININSKYFEHLRFADDILFINNVLAEMITKLDNHSKLVLLTINIDNTKTMASTEMPINIMLNGQFL